MLHEALMVKHAQQLCSDIEKAAVLLVVLCDTADLTPNDVWEKYGLTAIACLSCKASLQDVFQCVLDVTACQDHRNASGGGTAAAGPAGPAAGSPAADDSFSVGYSDGRSPPVTAPSHVPFHRTSWRSHSSTSMRLDTSLSHSRAISTLGKMGARSMPRKNLIHTARKPYDATTQRWQVLINRFEKEVRGVGPVSGEMRDDHLPFLFQWLPCCCP